MKHGLNTDMNETTQIKTAQPWIGRAKILHAVHSPLGFFVLSLLIVEVFLLGAGIWFNLSDALKIAALAVGVVLFLVVFFTVVFLVIKHPKNLVFSEESHVQFAAMQMFGTENQHITGKILEALPLERQANAVSAGDQPMQLPSSNKTI
jgi:hypothetical protein